MTTNLVVIGLGYVGLPMALRAAEAGMTVVGLDSNPGVVDRLNSGSSHIDDVSDEELAAGLRCGLHGVRGPRCHRRVPTSSSCACRPRWPKRAGPTSRPFARRPRRSADTSARARCASWSRRLTPGRPRRSSPRSSVASTSSPGGTCSSPSPLSASTPATRRSACATRPRWSGGLTPECGDRARAFYSQFIDTVVKAKRAREAEMAKLLENTFRHVNIALVNEMVRFCDELDIDLWDAIDCAETKPFGYMAFRPGPGRRRTLHPRRPVVPVTPGQGEARLRIPTRRAGGGDQHRRAALRRRARPRPAERAGPGRARRERAAARRDVQAEHLRPPREPCRPAGPSAPGLGRRPRATTTPTCRPGRSAPEGRPLTACRPGGAAVAADVVVSCSSGTVSTTFGALGETAGRLLDTRGAIDEKIRHRTPPMTNPDAVVGLGGGSTRGCLCDAPPVSLGQRRIPTHCRDRRVSAGPGVRRRRPERQRGRLRTATSPTAVRGKALHGPQRPR